MRLRFFPAARIDALEIAAYLLEQSPEATDRFLASLRSSTERLCEMPRSGRVWLSCDRLGEIRWIPVAGFANHLVFYRIGNKEIEVIRVLHGARDLDWEIER